MLESLALLQGLEPDWDKTSLRWLSRIAQAMLAMSGRVTMLGISRWTESGAAIGACSDFSTP